MSGGVIFSKNKEVENVNATQLTASTNFNEDWDGLGSEPGSVLVAYSSTTGGQLTATTTTTNNLNNSITEKSYSLIRVKNHNNHNLVLTFVYRIDSSLGAGGCTGGSLVSSTLGNSSYTRYSSGSGCYVLLGANDDATFKIDLVDSNYDRIRMGISIGVSTPLSGLFTIQSWKTYDASNDTLVDTTMEFGATNTDAIKGYSAKADSIKYKQLTTGIFANLSDFEGLPINFYDNLNSTYNNPNPSFILKPIGAHKTIQLKKETEGDNVKLLMGYGTDVNTIGTSFVIYKTNEYCSFSSIEITHRSDVTWHDNLYYSYTTNNGESWSEIAKVTWVGDSNGKTTTVNISDSATAVKFSHFANGVSASRTLIGIGSISVNYEKANIYELSFDTQGGSSIDSQIIDVSKSEVTTAPETAPTHENEDGYRYSFAGWYDSAEGGNEFVFGTTIYEDTTVYAHWNKEPISSYILTFETNGGTLIEPQNVEIGSNPTKPSSNPTKSGDERYAYKFKNWYTTSALSTIFSFDAPLTGDTTIYAGYERNSYIPTGSKNYNLKKSLHTNTNTGWGDNSDYDVFAERTFSSNTGNFGTGLPEVEIHIPSSGANSGMKRNSWEFVVNDTTVNVVLKDSTKYITSVHIEALAQDYTQANCKNVTLSSGGVTYDTQASPYSGLNHVVWMANFNSNLKVTSFDLNVPAIRTNKGIGLTNIYIEFGSFTNEDYAAIFAEGFNDNNVCGTSATDGLNETKWSNQADIYAELTVEVRAVFHNYEGSNTEIIECLERYDRVIYLHGEDYDFMGRIESDNIPTISSQKIGLFVSNITHNNSSIVLIVLSSFSVLAITAFFVTRRKEND